MEILQQRRQRRKARASGESALAPRRLGPAPPKGAMHGSKERLLSVGSPQPAIPFSRQKQWKWERGNAVPEVHERRRQPIGRSKAPAIMTKVTNLAAKSTI